MQTVEMVTGDEGLTLVMHYEQCRLTAYPDPGTGGDPWTIGWGSTGHGICKGLSWTQAQADAALAGDIQSFEDMVRKAVQVPLTQGQFDAMVSIVYNVGPGSSKRDGILRLKNGQPSTLLRKLNAGDYAGAQAQFHPWCKAGGCTMKGLQRRRHAESLVFSGIPARQAIAQALAAHP